MVRDAQIDDWSRRRERADVYDAIKFPRKRGYAVNRFGPDHWVHGEIMTTQELMSLARGATCRL